MNTLPGFVSLENSELFQRRLGASRHQIWRRYAEDSEFKAAWDDYVACLRDVHEPNLQKLSALEVVLRDGLRRSWDVVQDVVEVVVFGDAADVLNQLRKQHEFSGRNAYLVTLFPLIEMAWLGGKPNSQTSQLVRSAGRFICTRIMTLAGGLEIVEAEKLEAFFTRYLDCPVAPHDLHALSELGLDCIRTHSNVDLVEMREKTLWRACHEIASLGSNGKPNSQQMKRLAEIRPDRLCWHKNRQLAETSVPELLGCLRQAWVVH